jgi:tRNA pseudouridine55 synthase
LDQVPPAYSAKKVNGERMYRRARRGESVALEPTRVTVFEARILSVELPRVRFELSCSSGTYVRAVARDLGEALGCGAHLAELRRTRVGEFEVADAVSGDDLHDESLVREAWMKPAAALAHLPSVSLSEKDAGRFAHGQAVEWVGADVPEGRPLAVLHGGSLLGVGERTGDRVRPRKVLSVV